MLSTLCKSESDMDNINDFIVSNVGRKQKLVLNISIPTLFFAKILMENLHDELEERDITFQGDELELHFGITNPGQEDLMDGMDDMDDMDDIEDE